MLCILYVHCCYCNNPIKRWVYCFQICYVVLKSYKIYVGKIIKIKTTTRVQRPTFTDIYFSDLFLDFF